MALQDWSKSTWPAQIAVCAMRAELDWRPGSRRNDCFLAGWTTSRCGCCSLGTGYGRTGPLQAVASGGPAPPGAAAREEGRKTGWRFLTWEAAAEPANPWRNAVMKIPESIPTNTSIQCSVSSSVLDPYSGALWIRISIPKTDPDPRM